MRFALHFASIRLTVKVKVADNGRGKGQAGVRGFTSASTSSYKRVAYQSCKNDNEKKWRKQKDLDKVTMANTRQQRLFVVLYCTIV